MFELRSVEDKMHLHGVAEYPTQTPTCIDINPIVSNMLVHSRMVALVM